VWRDSTAFELRQTTWMEWRFACETSPARLLIGTLCVAGGVACRGQLTTVLLTSFLRREVARG
jgi:hypothetical protein